MSVATAAAAAVVAAQSFGTAVVVMSAVGRLQSAAVGRAVAAADFDTVVLVVADSVAGLPADFGMCAV